MKVEGYTRLSQFGQVFTFTSPIIGTLILCASMAGALFNSWPFIYTCIAIGGTFMGAGTLSGLFIFAYAIRKIELLQPKPLCGE